MKGHADKEHVPERVEASSASSTSALSEVERGEEHRVSAKDARSRRRVDSNRERAGGDDDAEDSATVEVLDERSVASVHSRVVDSDTATERVDDPGWELQPRKLVELLGELDLRDTLAAEAELLRRRVGIEGGGCKRVSD